MPVRVHNPPEQCKLGTSGCIKQSDRHDTCHIMLDPSFPIKPGGYVQYTPPDTPPNVALKFDDDKADLSLLSSTALLEIAKVMTFGKKKYSAHNWRNGFAWSRVYAAIQRHLLAFNNGERTDPETGLSHLAHAACGILFLLEFEKTGAGTDDLWNPKTKSDLP